MEGEEEDGGDQTRAQHPHPSPTVALVAAKRPRLAVTRRMPTATNRNPAAYILQQQAGGRRRASCLECHTMFEEGGLRVCRRLIWQPPGGGTMPSAYLED